MSAERPNSSRSLNALVVVLIGVAIVVSIVVGLRALGLAQTGDLRKVQTAGDRGVLVTEEMKKDEVRVHACTDAKGVTVYRNEPCAKDRDAAAGERTVEVQPLELPPKR